MSDIRAAESATAEDSTDNQQSGGRSIIFGQQQQTGEKDGGGSKVRGSPWSDEAKEAVRRLNEENGKEVVQLVSSSQSNLG